jgi:serine phosphatase RsbU (regulator of sigma subunit)
MQRGHLSSLRILTEDPLHVFCCEKRWNGYSLGKESKKPIRLLLINSGDRLLLFTDGITEAEGPDGEEFGTEKVTAFAKAHAANSAAKINQQLLAQVMELCGAQFQDDATLLVLAVK